MSRAEESNPDSGAATHNPPQARGCICSFWHRYIRVDPAWLREVRGHLITAATLTATMAYQSILSPPGSFWQEPTAASPAESTSYMREHNPGEAIMDSQFFGDTFAAYLRLNTIVLGASLSTIMLAMTGFPPENKFLTWLLVFTVYITISCMAASYGIAAKLVCPNLFPNDALYGMLLGWMSLCTFVMVLHSCRFLVWLWHKLVKLVKKCCSCCRQTPRPARNSTGKGNQADSSKSKGNLDC